MMEEDSKHLWKVLVVLLSQFTIILCNPIGENILEFI